MAQQPIMTGSTARIYIHELIDIIGHNRARYLHHMTANWVPIGLEERNQRCFGVWATVGSTGRWPEVVNMWELDGWDGLVRNLEVELEGGRDQDPSLAEWWATAASLRRGGVDRILVAEDWCRGIEQLCAEGVRGEVYAHELISVPPGTVDQFLGGLRAVGVPAVEALGATAVGAWKVAMVNDSECVAMWAFPDLATWAAYEQAWKPGERGGALDRWRNAAVDLGADWRRQLLIDAPLAPLRLGRQPQVSDRRRLEDI